MKRVYEQPSVVVKTFSTQDVIKTSGPELNSWRGEFTTDPYNKEDFC